MYSILSFLENTTDFHRLKYQIENMARGEVNINKISSNYMFQGQVTYYLPPYSVTSYLQWWV